MKSKFRNAGVALLAAVLIAVPGVQAQEPAGSADPAVAEAEWRTWADEILAKVSPEQGQVSLGKAPVVLNVTSDFDFYDAAESRILLEDLWGNPPDETVLGMAFPRGVSPAESLWGAVFTYEDTGYVSDDDAATTDYAELLKAMQADTEAGNPYRADQGFDTVTLKGWAETPRYDPETHRLYWAKDLVFSSSDGESTLNYDMRLLGRRGVLSVNFIGPIEALAEVRAAAPGLLEIASFNTNETYADYREGDRTAGYGVAALIAGGAGAAVLKKTGLLAVALIALKKVWILIPVFVMGLWRVFTGLFGGRARD